MLFVGAVEDAAHLAEALVRVDQDGLRRGEALARLEVPGEAVGVDAGDQARRVEAVDLHVDREVAAVHEVEAVHLAVFLRSAVLPERDERVVVVRGGAALAHDGLDAVAERALGDRALLRPFAVQVHHVVIVGRQLEAGAVHALEVHRRVGIVFDDDAAGHDRHILVYGVVELHDGAGRRVARRHLERLAVAVFIAQRGHAAERGLLFEDAVGDVADVGGDVAVFVADLQRGDAEVAGAGHGILARRHVRRNAGGDVVREVRAEGGEHAAVEHRKQVVVRQVSAVIQMEQIPRLVHGEGVACRRRIELEDFSGSVKGNGHNTSPFQRFHTSFFIIAALPGARNRHFVA